MGWPKKHQHVVEELPALSVRDPSADFLPKVSKRAGACSRKYFRCPACSRLVEELFLPAGHEPTVDLVLALVILRCRRCVGGTGAIYASQRYRDRSHPVRRVLTPRKRAGRGRRPGREPYLHPRAETMRREAVRLARDLEILDALSRS